jgi:two-component system response regulator (stage 0 sporulation protein F)
MHNIMIVDDQPHLCELISEELREEGYRVTCVGDAESVKAYFQNSRPDLVVLDLYLKGFEGWDLLHEIKSEYPQMPVLIVTAYDSYADDPRVSEADGYMVKSFRTLEGLKQKIAEIFVLKHRKYGG